MASVPLSLIVSTRKVGKVIFVDINGPKGEAKAGDSPRLIFVEGDVTKRETWEDVLTLAVSRFDRFDVVINNAGKQYCIPYLMASISADVQ